MNNIIRTLELLEFKSSGTTHYRGFEYYHDPDAPIASQWKAKEAKAGGVTMNTSTEAGIKRMIDNKYVDMKRNFL
jgi:hypothetical protein